MIPVSELKVASVQQDFEEDIKSHIIAVTEKLTALKTDPEISPIQRQYAALLFSKSDVIMTDKSSLLLEHAGEFNAIISPATMASDDSEAFRKKVLAAMQYSKRRSDFYPKYFKALGIKTCVYCNSQLAITVEDEEGELVARFQVDHFLPKNNYPCFSVSLFNLYPSCASCNNIKGTKEVDFQLYVADKPAYQSPFTFMLLPGVKAKFSNSRNRDDIGFSFEEPDPAEGKERFNAVFSIMGIYQTQLDVAEELFIKEEVYSPAYRDILTKDFPELFRDAAFLDRIISGNYTEEKDIHLRPLSKFTMDIAGQLGLLKKT
jgi:hypothetical protein